MVLTTKQFDAIANYVDTISYLEDQLDQCLTNFAKLGKKQRKERLAQTHGYIVYKIREDYYDESGWHLCELGKIIEKFPDDLQDKIRQKIVNDYTKAGWTISWQREDGIVRENRVNHTNTKVFTYVLKIKQ